MSTEEMERNLEEYDKSKKVYDKQVIETDKVLERNKEVRYKRMLSEKKKKEKEEKQKKEKADKLLAKEWEEINRWFDREARMNVCRDNKVDVDRQSWWKEHIETVEKVTKPELEPKFRKFYELGKHAKKSTKGKILSWGYFKEINCFAIKREGGVNYIERPSHFKTLPYFEIMQLAKLKLLYADENNVSGWCQRKLRIEYATGKWDMFKSTAARFSIHPTKRNSKGGPVRVVKFKPAKYMKVLSMKPMPQDICKNFRWWFYDELSEEAVILFRKKGEFVQLDSVRIFDPMWLRNLSSFDVSVLHRNRITYREEKKEQAMKYQRVIDVFHAYLSKDRDAQSSNQV